MSEPKPLYLVPAPNGCDDRLFVVTAPITFKVRALDKKDVFERVKVTVVGAEGEIAVGLPFIQEVEERASAEPQSAARD